ncbi:MAG: pantoate--beta-alanine ligase [Candidatus Omnitrophica bacterium]|nr:pantoate--beta-alanine ligase [Candidatus Omnitrophota bacterium]
MKVIKNPKALQKILAGHRRGGQSIGFVPTMGALHEGHLSLVRASRRENDVTVVSIFVNPTQFGPKEDLKKYPRPIRRDKKLLILEKTDYLFLPSVEAMYPPGQPVYVDTEKSGRDSLTDRLCGKYRLGHFRGVLTVVAKLFNIVLPDRAYFGQKDYQQAVIVRRLIEDLHLNIFLKILPVIREKNGLAMSSRNRYLNHEEKMRALSLSRELFSMRRQIIQGQKNLKTLCRSAARRLSRSLDRLQYLEIVDPVSLAPAQCLRGNEVVLAAGYVGKTRLIDNVIIPPLRGVKKRLSKSRLTR